MCLFCNSYTSLTPLSFYEEQTKTTNCLIWWNHFYKTRRFPAPSVQTWANMSSCDCSSMKDSLLTAGGGWSTCTGVEPHLDLQDGFSPDKLRWVTAGKEAAGCFHGSTEDSDVHWGDVWLVVLQEHVWHSRVGTVWSELQLLGKPSLKVH